ncbi:GNAT family N-acetyltransferase [Streptomonospora nanhaiensis]|uniref:GNAT superfamily N-acetyltransferase n=1 Tax=Streptomonospora nanhaiensis TaxID=1323731 RepID=A0A853BNR6_9ACTN|nr:GNAT family N-acetyltransferase [Streptomonospora nanhaiensis]MBV2365139.1 GNAT family N-acetyltransferase [Streptomonospora nanhaiensis]MBX9387774.1 GNAT family N-acetyltransferase [Streptomonospora nanhaiensis]NYI96650.1 GNAT superfamily N-acetyltransferase [Streptomonospora nanhaiensis]
MIIRAAIRSDLGAILRLLRELGDTTPAQSSTVRMSSAAVRAWTRIENDPDRTVLVAERRGQIIGTLDLLVVPNLTHDAQSWAVVDNLVVDPACRRAGVGRALVEDAVDRASRAGCYKIELVSHESRAGARQFSTAMGFAGSAEGFRRYL